MALLTSTNVLAQSTDTQRYAGLMLLNLDRNPDAYTSLIDGSLDAGSNLVQLTIYWDEVHKTPTAAADWRQPDQQIAQITKRGVKVAIRIMLSRAMSRIEGYWTDKERPQDWNFKPMEGIYGRTSFSLTSASAVAKARDFVQEVCKRYEPYQQQGNILFVSFVNSPIQELGHHVTNYPEGDWVKDNPREFFTIYDYCPMAATAFRNWLRSQYGTLEKLNYHWQAQETTWDELTVPHVYDADSQISLFRQRKAKEFYLFSHLTLKNFINTLTESIRSVNVSYKVINEYGGVIDPTSVLRTSLCFKDLDQNADGTKINNDIRYDHKFMTDVVRSNRPNRWVMNEVFYDRVSSTAEYVRQFDECFDHGSKIVVFVIPDITFFAATRPVLTQVTARWLARPLVPISTNVTMQYTASQVMDASPQVVLNEWAIKAGPTRQSINVQLVEDILNDDFWKKVRQNVAPTVKEPIFDKAAKVRKRWTFKVPSSTFFDADGFIQRIEAIGLPSWLKFENNEFVGDAPAQVGEYNIRLRAIDNENGVVELNFKLSLVDTNQKPVATAKMPDYQMYLKQYVEFKVSSFFNDPDGNIVRVQGRGIQPWMSLDNTSFSAYPQSVYGNFPVTIRVYDEDSAWVESSFAIRVLNQQPKVIAAPEPKIIAQGKPFRYNLARVPIFEDPDGTIVRLRVLGMPGWMSFQNNELSGTPPVLGTFPVTIRAYDNGNDSTQVTLNVIVDSRQNLNNPPLVRFKIPDAKIMILQNFEYIVSDSLFYDPNGYIDRVEAPNLPSWLKFSNKKISGKATKAGTYTITLRATDDDESTVSTSFLVEVTNPKLTFKLMKAGMAGTRAELGEIKQNDQFDATKLPERINIHTLSDAAVQRVQVEISGPQRVSIDSKVFPYVLFDDTKGFIPMVGSYTYKATAWIDSFVVAQKTVDFKITSPQPIADWVVYPNPSNSVFNVKLPQNLNPKTLKVKLIDLNGITQTLSNDLILIKDNTAHIAIGGLVLPVGTYFLELIEDQESKKIVKIVKNF